MGDFERTAWPDSCYSVLRKALTLATRFESLCRTLSALLGIKIIEDKSKSALESEEIIDLVDKLPQSVIFRRVD